MSTSSLQPARWFLPCVAGLFLALMPMVGHLTAAEDSGLRWSVYNYDKKEKRVYRGIITVETFKFATWWRPTSTGNYFLHELWRLYPNAGDASGAPEYYRSRWSFPTPMIGQKWFSQTAFDTYKVGNTKTEVLFENYSATNSKFHIFIKQKQLSPGSDREYLHPETDYDTIKTMMLYIPPADPDGQMVYSRKVQIEPGDMVEWVGFVVALPRKHAN